MDNHYPLLSAEQLEMRIADADLRVLDCRFDLLAPDAGRSGYLSAHIPGAVYADLNKDLAAPPNDATGRHPLPTLAAIASTFGRLGIGDETFVVIYDDRSGAIAARAWWMLRWLGHPRVAILDGGLAAWSRGERALEHGNVPVASRTFTARPQRGRIIDSNEIRAAVNSGMTLVDARAASRFAGLQEPIDAVAGHIPGAINLPYEHGLDASGLWRPADELRGLWLTVFPDGPQEPWSVMCGSGVTACHLAVSAELAGLPAPRLYVGSWSEWIRDVGRPIATGAL